MEESRLRLGEILVDAGVLSESQLDIALSIQKKRGLRLGQILLQEGFISEPQLVQALSRRLSIPWVSLEHVDVADELLELVPARVAEEFFLIPVYIQTLDRYNRTLFVAMNDPTDEAALRFVSATAGMPVKPMVAGPSDISAAIQIYYYGEEDSGTYTTPMIHTSVEPPVNTLPPSSTIPPSAQKKTVPTPDEGELCSEEPISITEEMSESLVTQADNDSREPQSGSVPTEEVTSADEKADRHSKIQREVEKHMFGVGKKKHRGISLTLLDGTTIDFGGSNRRGTASPVDTARLAFLKNLRAAAEDAGARSDLPAEKWETFMAALLEVLFKKNLLFFDEFIMALKKEE